MLFTRPQRILPLACLVVALAGASLRSGVFAEAPPPPDPVVPAEPEAPKDAEKEKEAPELTAEDVNRLIDDLSSDDFATREQAQRMLGKATIAGGLAEVMRLRFAKTDNPEVKLRLRRVLYEVAKSEFLGRKKAFLGIQMQDSVLIGGKTGREMILSVMVLSVIPDSAAEENGIEGGDHIMSVNGKGFESVPSTEFKGIIGSFAAGDKVKFRLRRGGVESEKTVRLGVMPADLAIANTQSQAAFESYFQLWLERGGAMPRQ